MFSRIALRTGDYFKPSVIRSSLFCRACHNEVGNERVYKREVLNVKEGPERDVVNFPRYKMPEFPGKVRLGFIPDEWFQFMYNKTGVTGPYVLGIGFATYLISKEIYVMEHEFYTGLSLFIMAVFAIKKFGPQVAASLDKQVDDTDNKNKHMVSEAKQSFIDGIANEEKVQWQAKGMSATLIEAKRENVLLQLEAAFRERQMMVYEAVKKCLDYQVEKQNTERRLQQKHMVNWIVNSVVKSITPQQEKEALQKCINDLKMLASKATAM